MKQMLKYFILLSVIIFVGTVHLKLSQLNYRDQYEQCLDDYQKMYKMMDSKLKFYAENEKSLLESVKSTIFKAYEKSEQTMQKWKREKAEIEDKNRNVKAILDSKQKEMDEMKEEYEKKLQKLNSDLALKNTQLDRITVNYRVVLGDLKKCNISVEDFKIQIGDYKKIIVKKDTECADKINECTAQIQAQQSEEIKNLNNNDSNLNFNVTENLDNIQNKQEHLDKMLQNNNVRTKYFNNI